MNASARVGAAVVVTALLASTLSGCGLLNTVRKIHGALETNKQIIDSFTSNLNSHSTTPFEATYVTTGTSPTTVVYAVEPPKELTFKNTPARTANAAVAVDIVANSSGEYACTSPPASPAWTCEKLPTASAASQNQIFDLYTPSHWVAFLNGFSLAAGFAGDKISASTMDLNGFNMRCVDFVATGEPGTSAICTTSQGILGYVKVASETTSFRIESFTRSPSASLFDLPPGARIKAPQPATT